MGFLKQTWTLTSKNLLIVFRRHFLSTFIRAFVLPVGYMIFLTYARNLFISNDIFGVGSGQPVLTLAQGLAAADGGRSNLVFVNNGLSGGDIDRVIDLVAAAVPPTVMVTRLTNDSDIPTICRSSLRGVTQCYGAVIFNSSPTEGKSGVWNYTIRVDGALGRVINVDSHSNDAEIYILPLQHAVDYTIAAINTTINHAALPSTVLEYSYTDLTQAELQTQIRVAFQDTVINIVAVAFLVGMIGIVYHESGFIASEREMGMSQLLEAMMPNRRRWEPQLARILSYHLAFDIIYLPGWLVMGAVLGSGLWADSNIAIVIIQHLLAGLALSSWSIFGAAAFKRAQLSGITVSIVSLLLGILAQVLVSKNSRSIAVAVLSLLFPPCNYVFFIVILARYEQQKLPTNLVHGAPNNWNLPGILLWVFSIIAIVVFPLLGILIERGVHSTTSKGRTVTTSNASSEDERAPENHKMIHNTIELRHFSKHYPPSWIKRRTAFFRKLPPTTVIAVNDLTLTAAKGQILVLLGANGSGKSTTLDAIVGINTITSGTITVDGTRGVGICPQKNVLWPDVKVSEHIRIFNSLKTNGEGDSNEVLHNLIKAVDLDRKLHAKAKILSGGQKRKLQLGIMLTGGSGVCAVDEVSSGLDPLSRRKIWDILLAERGERTIILTTHFLDEADLLADHIAILSKGTLRAQGSSAELKNTIGGGYRIHLYTGPGHKVAPAIPDIRMDVTFDQTTYSAQSCKEAALVIRTLEKEGIDDYKLSGPTIEDVFLQLAEEVHPESDSDLARDLPGPTTVDIKGKYPKVSTILLKSEAEKLELLSGTTIGFGRQAWVLFRKRFTLLGRNYMPYIAAFIIPILAGGLVTNLVKHQGQAGCSPGQQDSNRATQTTGNQPDYDIVIGPSSIVTNAFQLLQPLFGGFGTGSNASQTIGSLYSQNSFHLVETASDFNSYISTNYANVTPGGIFVGDSTSPPIFAYQADATIFTSAFSQNVMDTLLTNITIITQFKRFDIPWSADTGNSLQLVVYFGLVMAAAPAFFSLYPTLERVRHVRGLQYSNGVRALPLWLAYLLFDSSIVLFSTSVVAIIFAAVARRVWYHLGYLFLVLLLYNVTSILVAYVVSLYAKSQLSAFAIAAGGQAVLFLSYLVGYLCTITYAPVVSIDYELLAVHFGASVVIPLGSLVRALFVALNLFSTTCEGSQVASYPGGIKYYGGPILYLIIQSIALFTFLILHDTSSLLTRLRGSESPPPAPEEAIVEDEKVVEELNRVNTSNDCLRLIHVMKSFGRNTAVEDLTFGVARDEVFALLGPNGAGKSTTISLIRGDIQPSRNGGQIFVDGILVSKHRAQARSHLGVCPQFDAMDTLTVTEHLQFYARVRGVSDIEHNVQAVIQAVGLQNYTSRMAAQLSGGNKRKLSLAIALMGNPAVLLLDEPSSGMDAAAKRIMWKTLTGVVVGRSILLTTHSMEEAGALASRAGIMAKRMLAMGTTEYLRHKHGAAYYCHLVTKTAPHTPDEEMSRLRDWVLEQFPEADMEPKTYHGQLRFAVPANSERLKRVATAGSTRDEIVNVPELPSIDGGIGFILALLEDHRVELGLAHYAVSPTTLDQVFLSIVEKHNVEEENYAVKSESSNIFKFKVVT